MKSPLAVLAALGALALPAAAHGKELTGIALCGPAGCADVDRSFGHRGLSLDSGFRMPAPAGEYYRVELEVDGATDVGFYYVPGAGLLTSETETGWMQWLRPTPALGRAFRRLARRVEPFPAPAVASARLDGKRLGGDPDSYLGLFELRSKPAYPGDWPILSLSLSADRPSPWTDTNLAYFPEENVLQLAPGRFVRVPLQVAAKLEGRPDAAAGGASDDESTVFQGETVGLAAGIGALVAVATLVAARRRTRG